MNHKFKKIPKQIYRKALFTNPFCWKHQPREKELQPRKKRRPEKKLKRKVRPLFAGSTSRVEMAPIVPPSNPNNDSRVYEVDIDVDTKERVWEVKQKDEVKERFEHVKEQQKP